MAIGTPTVRYGTRATGVNASLTFNPTSNITAGTRAILFGGMGSGNGVLSSVTDSVGNTWTVHATNLDATSTTSIFCASCQVATTITTANTITTTNSLAFSTNMDMWVVEVSGLATSSAFDKTAATTGSGSAYTAGATATLSQADEIAIAVWRQSFTAGPSHTPGASWTEFTTSTVSAATAVYQIVAATTALTASETSTNTNWNGLISTFKAAVAAPSNSVAPVASGTATVGQTLSTTDGTWTGSPTFGYQWQRDTGGNLSFSNIAAATSNTYVLVDADDGNKVRCVVTGTNAGGSATGNSNALGLVIEPVPTISVAPAVTGLTTIGSTLSCTTGTWTHQGGSVATYAYQWQRDVLGNGSYSNIASATSSTYVLVLADDACNVRCVVTATNSGGAGTAANSNAVLDTTAVPTSSGTGVQDDADIVFLFDL